MEYPLELGHMNITEQYRFLNHMLDRVTDPDRVNWIVTRLNQIESLRLNITLVKEPIK